MNAKVTNNLFVSNAYTLLDVTVDLDRLKVKNLTNNGALKVGLTADSGATALNDTLGAENSYYVLLDNQEISAARTLTIEPGVTVNFNTNTSAITVNGRLLALGTSTNPIYFSGDNLNYNASDRKGPITFNSTGSNSVLSYVIIDQLGYANNARSITAGIIIAKSASLSINKCVIQNSQGVGLIVDGNASPNVVGTCFSTSTNGSVRVFSGKPKFYRCNFNGTNNTTEGKYGVINASTNSADTVSARECWWNSPNGPKNSTANPGGTGDSVSPKVVFTSFSSIPFNCPNSDDDLSITSILSPKVSCNLKDAENLTVVIKNNGSSLISGYTITYQVNNNPIVRESPAAIGAGLSLTYTFATKANLSYGNGTVYNIKVYTELAADPVNNNDTAWATITNIKPFLGNDTTLLICSGSSGNLTTLYSTNRYDSVKWRRGVQIPRPDSVTTAGKDTLIVTNNFGCKDTAVVTVVITAGAAITSTFTTTSAGCFGGSAGSITVTPTNGKAPYWYKNGPTGAFQSANLFKNLKAGNYTVYIKDSNNCAGNTPVIAVTQNAKINTTFIKTDATCIGKADGTIKVTATGGRAPFQYKLGVAGIYRSSSLFTSLKAGSYVVYVKDLSGCVVATSTIVVGQANVVCKFPMAVNAEDNYTQQILLSPNPTNNEFTLQLHNDKTEPVLLNVTDVNGKTMYATKGNAASTFRFGSSLAPGVYLVTIRQGEEIKSLKAVKLK